MVPMPMLFSKHRSSILWHLHLHILHLHFLLLYFHTDKILLFHPCSVPTLRLTEQEKAEWKLQEKSLKITKPAFEVQLCHDCLRGFLFLISMLALKTNKSNVSGEYRREWGPLGTHQVALLFHHFPLVNCPFSWMFFLQVHLFLSG